MSEDNIKIARVINGFVVCTTNEYGCTITTKIATTPAMLAKQIEEWGRGPKKVKAVKGSS